jgi:4-amino-4-deoxy-L-arabinose transferase-like glycosyltransferase
LNPPTPAIVTQRAARRLPRLALLLLCAAYVLPGHFGRDPWRNADVTAYGYMYGLAQGGDWWHPLMAGLPSSGGLLPYWLGALSIQVLGGWLGPELAARVPFALLLAATLALTWYSGYHLARTEAAQPVAFAFGGEAHPVDYARAVADGAVLALLACLGLLQLGHEITPELMQLAGASLALYAVSASTYRGWQPRLAMLAALPLMAGSGAASIALALALAASIICLRSDDDSTRNFAPWILASALLAGLLATALGTWRWHVLDWPSPAQVSRLLLWFTWPAWLLAGWTLWRWRHHLLHRHIAWPLAVAAIAVFACVAMNGSDRALLLGLPALAVLSAFALPTLRRPMASAIDWFSVCFFTAIALFVWVMYSAMHTGIPAKPAANIAKLAPGFEAQFSVPAFVLGLAATLAWGWLVRWRTGRHREALWRSLVLPAGGVTLVWLLMLTLWLPLLNYARSDRPLVERLAHHLPAKGCVRVSGLPKHQLAALESLGGYTLVQGLEDPAVPSCDHLLLVGNRRTPPQAPSGWTLIAAERRPTDRQEQTYVFRRTAAMHSSAEAP